MDHPNIRHITSPANDHIKDMRGLALRKNRKETGLFLAEGLRHVIEGVECGWELTHLAFAADLGNKPDVERAIRACLHNDGHVMSVNDKVLEKLARKDNPSQVIGVFKQKTVDIASIDTGGTWVALEQVRDPGNLGTIMRTIDGVGAKGVILIDQCCDAFSVEAVRATMGSLFSVPIAYATKDEFIALAKSWQGTVVGTALNDRTVDYREVTYKNPVLLVMGNEQAGLSENLMNALPTLVKLPMQGRADSLNLAVATGVMLYTTNY